MIKSERAFTAAMRKMIIRIIKGKPPLHNPPTDDDYEVLAECINRGLLLSSDQLEDGTVMRTMDGKAHPAVNANIVPLKGLAFLRPDRTRLRANIALALSIIAILVSVLSNLVPIVDNVRLIAALLTTAITNLIS